MEARNPGMRTDLSPKLNWLSRDSQMAALISDKDWSKTPLGPIESWPLSLRTTVSLCLGSNFPINIVWGPDAIQIYNDGYLVVCGDAHPRALGEDYRVTWASAWPAIGEPFDRARRSETSYLENQRMFLNRNGYLEETFFTFSLSPILDGDGNVAGLFHPVTETTATMLAQRRTRALRDLAEIAGKARTVKEACALTSRALSKFEFDVPFALSYLIDKNGECARLETNFGLPSGSKASPEIMNFGGIGETPWLLGRNFASERLIPVIDFEERFGTFTFAPYPEPIKSAVILPIHGVGKNSSPALFIVGVSPRLPLDESYLSFIGLLADAIGAAFHNALAFEEEKNRSEALAEIDRAKIAFFSNVSHEFRTPLTLMLGPLQENLLHQEGLPPEFVQRDQVAYRNGIRLLKLVDTLLDFSQIEADRLKAEYRLTDLSLLTVDIASVFRSLVEKAGLRFQVRAEPLGELVYVDRKMWEKIVLNLLSNAFKFTLHGEIEVNLEAREGEAVLTVRDSGEGIPEADLPHLFERFHRIEEIKGRSTEGSGIGLALIKELAALHGGSISVTSQLGIGSQFVVRIPLGIAHLPADKLTDDQALQSLGSLGNSFLEEAKRWIPKEAPEALALQGLETKIKAEIGAHARKLDRERILVVDDNEDMRSYLESLLKTWWEVETVEDGEAAMNSALQRAPDLILSDVMMPKLDGFGLLAKLRADDKTKKIPVILLSARSGEDAWVEGIECGADDYLAKPFAARELVALVRSNLRLYEARRAVETERQLLHDFFTQAPVPLVILEGPDHRFILANKPYETLTGKEVMGKTVREIFSEEFCDTFIPLLDHVYQTGIPFVGKALPRARPGKDRDGPEIQYIDVAYHPFRGPSGEIKGILAVIHDVTEQKKLVSELESEREIRAQFVDTLTHDLRTPLTVAKMSAQLIARNIKDIKVSERLATHIVASIERADQMIRDLLDANLIKAYEKQPMKIEPCQLNSIAIDTLNDISIIHGNRFAFSSDAVIDGYWSPNAIRRVIENLCINAIKYGAIDTPVSVSLHLEGDSVEVRVHNEGPPISTEDQAIIFNHHRRTQSAHNGAQKGWGLGLALVKNIAEAHGGRVSVKSELSGGTTFLVMLPLNTKAGAG
jgi:PAS domain S-box-containing protein